MKRWTLSINFVSKAKPTFTTGCWSHQGPLCRQEDLSICQKSSVNVIAWSCQNKGFESRWLLLNLLVSPLVNMLFVLCVSLIAFIPLYGRLRFSDSHRITQICLISQWTDAKSWLQLDSRTIALVGRLPLVVPGGQTCDLFPWKFRGKWNEKGKRSRP